MPKNDVTNLLKNIFDLLNRFYSNEKLSIKDIEDIYGVSKRTAYRYINEYLKPAGFNIVKVDNKFKLKRDDNFDTFVIETIKNFSKEVGVYNKLKSIFKDLETKNIVYSKFNVEKIIDIEIYDILINAIENKQEIRFLYKRYNKKYKLKPLKVVNFEGYWYLVGIDKGYLRFHLNEIDEIEFLGEYELNEDIDLKNAINIWFIPNNEAFSVEFLANANVVDYIKRLPLNPTQIEINKYEDGSVLFQVEITHKEEIKRFIKSFLPDIKIISPKWLKEELEEEIKEYLN